MIAKRSIRPETGIGWDLSNESSEAGRTLGQLTDHLQKRRAESVTIRDWQQIPDLMRRYDAMPLAPSVFIELYRNLPQLIKNELIHPVELLRLQSEKDWRRVYLIKDYEGIRIYFVDPQNIVLAQSKLNDGFFHRWEKIQNPSSIPLDSIDEFAGRIFSADEFFQAIVPAGPVGLSGIESIGQKLLKGKLVEVGISAQTSDQYSELALEVVLPDDEIEVHHLFIPLNDAEALFNELSDKKLLSSGDAK